MPDLALGRVHASPMRIERKGEGIQMRGDVAGAARIRVVAPCPPDICRPFEHHKVFLSVLLESNRHAQAGEPRSQDGYTDMMDRSFVVRQPNWKRRAPVFVRKLLTGPIARKNPKHDCILQGLTAR